MSERRETIRGGAMEDVIDEHARWVAEGLRATFDETSITLDPMSEEKIEPALSAEEWRERRITFTSADDLAAHDDGDGIEFVVYPSAEELHRRSGLLSKHKIPSWAVDDMARLIALLNSGLPDDDLRKITREWVRLLADASVHETSCASLDEESPSTAECDCKGPALAQQIAAALQSYLPPETGT